MSNQVSTVVAATEFTVVRVINKIERELTETNVLLSGKKAERIAIADAKLLDQWNNGYFASLLATFTGALGTMVQDNLAGACCRMNDAEALNGKVGTHDITKPNRVMVALCLGGVAAQLDAKALKSKSGVLKGETARFHAYAKDFTAKYKANVEQRAAAAARAAELPAPALM